MLKFKKALWVALGMLFIGIAYIGVITPGIPWSTPSVAAAFCFAKGSDRWHTWIMNHRIFGPFLHNWTEKKIFPTYGKWCMVISMDVSLIILWLTTGNLWLVGGVAILMVIGGTWAWKYPGSIKEWEQRVKDGKKLGWIH